KTSFSHTYPPVVLHLYQLINFPVKTLLHRRYLKNRSHFLRYSKPSDKLFESYFLNASKVKIKMQNKKDTYSIRILMSINPESTNFTFTFLKRFNFNTIIF